jgi:transcriptional regulator with XRE-family HTH domain
MRSKLANPMMDLAEIGALIRKARKEKKLSQAELGVKSNVSRNTIEAIENARAPEAGLMLILRILHTLDLDLTPGTFNFGRPTLDQLREEWEIENAPRTGRR